MSSAGAAMTNVLAISPLVRVDRLADGNRWMISSGQGERRQSFETGSRALIEWLAATGAREAMPVDRIADSLERATELSATDAHTLVDTLLSYDVFVPEAEAETLRAKAARWERHGWRDAFDFHFAVSGTRWDRTRGGEYEDALRSLYDDVHLVGPQPPAERSWTAPAAGVPERPRPAAARGRKFR